MSDQQLGISGHRVAASIDDGLAHGMLDAVQQAVVARDPSGNIFYWNNFAERLYGWSAAEVLGRKLRDLDMLPDELLARGKEIIAQVKAGRSWSGEFVVRRRDGALLPIYSTDSPMYDRAGALVGLVAVSFDASEQRRAEMDRERLAAIVTSSEDAIVAWNMDDGAVTSWNAVTSCRRTAVWLRGQRDDRQHALLHRSA